MFAKPSLIAASLALGLTSFAATGAEAHRRWLLPSMTVLSGESELVSVDAAASNELFVFEHRPLGLEDLVITGPDGQKVDAKVIGSGDYRSIFDVPLKAQGTYRIALVSNGTMGTYELNGERQRFRGNVADVPAGATNVQLSENSSRTETFVTLGEPTDTSIQPTNKGLEMIPVTHPNDIVAGEPAVMRFLLDGQPAAGLEVEFVEGGTRYRDDAGIKNLTTDANGQLTLEVAEAGMYYLETGSSTEGAAGTAGKRSSYTAVLEFLPL